MFINHLTSRVLIILLLLVWGAGNGHAGGDSKIPITTVSDQAREYYLQGRDMEERLRAREARLFYEKAVNEDSAFALAYLNLSFAQPTSLGFFDKFNRALALAPAVSEGERLMILAVKAANDGDPLKQRDFYQKLTELFPNDERAYNLLGTSYYGLQDYQQAIEQYTRAITINPEFSTPYNMLGYCYRALEKYVEAEKVFKKYVELIPDDPNPYDSYAELLMKMGDYARSIEFYQKALRVSPDFDASHIGIASNFNFLGQYQKAREQLQKCLNNAEDVGQRRRALSGIALSFLDEGQIDSALAYVNMELSLAKKENDALAQARDMITSGNILLKSGRHNEALTSFEGAVQIIGESNLGQELKENAQRGFLYNAALVLTAKGDFAAATARADDYYRRIEPTGNPYQVRLAHELRGIIALAEEKYDVAVTELLQANLENPYNCYRLALAHAGAGRKDQAREMCLKAANFNTTNDFNLALIRNDAKRLLIEL
jgi:tetratricopeptide (TPR) repeat protein